MKNNKKRILPRILYGSSALILLFLISIFGLYIYINNNIDFSVDEALFAQSKSCNVTRFYFNCSDSNEYSPREFESIDPIGNRKSWYNFSDIGDNLKKAFIAAEDRSFYDHNGIDKKRTAYAVINYFFHIKPKFGGSSITQQVIKNISGDNESTPKRKIEEMIRAIHIEYTHSKDEILEVYMNVIPMGEKISGVGLASKAYFGKEPDELSCSEAAALVGMANAPSKYNPYINYKGCLEKRNKVLYAMLECKYIDEDEYLRSKSEQIILEPRSYNKNIVNSWFVETVCDDIVKDLKEQKNISENAARMLILNGGLSIYTTVNPRIQSILEDYFQDINNFPNEVENGLDYSMVITDSRTGDLLGIVGSVGEKNKNRILNNALTLHPPGSSIKPLALYAPIINSKKANWATVFDDSPVQFNKNSLGEYIPYPQNSPKCYSGFIPLSDALRSSKNTVAVRLYEILGKKEIYNNLKNNYGFDTIVDIKKMDDGRTITDLDVSPLALGQLSYGISLRKITESYTVFPGEGVLRKGRSYVAVYDSSASPLLINSSSEKEILSVETARIMNQMLSLVVESGTAKGIELNRVIDTAGKTGTSGNDRNRFFIGYTPYITAGIRCGYNDNRSIGYQNITHLKIWDSVMIKIHEELLKNEDNILVFSKEGLEYLSYCRDSGMNYTTECDFDLRGARIEFGYFTSDNKPTDSCYRHKLCYYDIKNEEIKYDNDGTVNENAILISLLEIPDRNFPCDVIIGDFEYIIDNNMITIENEKRKYNNR